MNIKEKHESLLYPMVRVRTEKAGGSGTIIYSEPLPDCEDKFETYLLSNFHVVENAVRQEKQWNPLLQRDVKKDVLAEVTVEQFDFEYESWEPTTRGYNGEVMIYDKNMDIALVRVKSIKQFPYTAKLFSKGKEREELRLFTPVYAVGCGLGHPIFQTKGELAGFNDVIENYPYWLSTAPTIFGNSGGAVFLKETGEYIGIPSRISVIILGLGGDAITHMSYFIPITSIYEFLENNIFQFIYDQNYNSKQCEEMRKEKRERDEKRMAIDLSREEAGDN